MKNNETSYFKSMLLKLRRTTESKIEKEVYDLANAIFGDVDYKLAREYHLGKLKEELNDIHFVENCIAKKEAIKKLTHVIDVYFKYNLKKIHIIQFFKYTLVITKKHV